MVWGVYFFIIIKYSLKEQSKTWDASGGEQQVYGATLEWSLC